MDDITKAAGLPPNWKPVDVPPVKPNQFLAAPPPPNAMDSYFQGSISPTMQHDAVFVGTQYGTPRIPGTPLMPISPSGSPGINSAAKNTTIINNTTSSGGTSFGAITSGANTNAAMVVGSGSALTPSGSGVIESSSLETTGAAVNVGNSNPPAHAGQLLISQPGNMTAVWADPLVQGLFAPGTNVLTGNAGGVINPVLVGAATPAHLLANLNLDVLGNLLVNIGASTGTASVQGALTNNNAAPSTNNLGVLPAVANAAAQSWTEGDQVLLSEDLAGNLRVVLKAETTKVIGTINVATGQKIEIYDGTNTATVKAASTAVVATDTALVVAVSPNVPATSVLTALAISSTANPVVAVATGGGTTTIRIFRIFFVNSGVSPTTITIQDSTTTNFSGAFVLAANGSFSADGNGDPLFVCAANKAFQLVNSAGMQISGTVWYVVN